MRIIVEEEIVHLMRLVWFVGIVAACGGGAEQKPGAGPGDAGAAAAGDSVISAPQSPVPDTGEAGDPPADWETGPLTGGSAAAMATLGDVRVATHADYDRIVFGFGDDEVPGYRIAIVDGPPVQCGSGEPVKVKEPVVLDVAFEPARAHTEEGAATVRDRSLRPALRVVGSLVLTCDFEAHVDWVAGLTGPVAMRTMLLREPNRLVLDLARIGTAALRPDSTP